MNSFILSSHWFNMTKQHINAAYESKKQGKEYIFYCVAAVLARMEYECYSALEKARR